MVQPGRTYFMVLSPRADGYLSAGNKNFRLYEKSVKVRFIYNYQKQVLC